MDGQPVWLASLSLRDAATGRIFGTAQWPRQFFAEAAAAISGQALMGVGDAGRERHFRMNVTYCVHRAATDAELEGLGPDFLTRPGTGIAGGPLEVPWENVPGKPSTRPCEQPGRAYSFPNRPDLWIPTDCGRCAPCQARSKVETYR